MMTKGMERKNKKKKCYTYRRVSTDLQIDGYSLSAQQDRLKKEAEYREMEIVGEFVDEGKSGKSIAGRPEFQHMLEKIQNGNEDDVEYVLVFKLSRFGRNTEDVLKSLRIMQEHNVNLIACEEGIDSAGPAGKLMISVIAAVAEIERENIRVQTMAGRLQKAREGKWNGGQAPFGYRLNKEKGILEVDEEEAEIVRLIYERYLYYGDGMNGVAAWLNNNGYRKKMRGNGKYETFSVELVKRVLDNPVYIGKIVYGRSQTLYVDGKLKRQSKEDYELCDGQHEAIISQKDWEYARQKRKETGFKREKTHSIEHEHVLSGILRCPSCGAPMYGSVNRKKRKAGGYYPDSFYYSCKNRRAHTGTECNFRYQPAQESVNAEIIAVMMYAIKSPTFADTMRAIMDEAVDEQAVKARLDNLRKVYNQYEGTKSKLIDQIDKLDVESPIYDMKFEDLNKRLDKVYWEICSVEKSIREAQQDLDRLNQNAATLMSAYKFLEETSDTLPKMTYAEQKQIINAFIDEIHIFPEKQKSGRWVKEIHFRFPVMIGDEEDDWWRLEDTDETVCLLSKLNVKQHIEVELTMDEMDLTAAEKKASYEEIKAYVREKFGLKVSNLYIAQVKRKCRIIERENYNLPKSEDSQQPQCPPEKEAAIRETLEYFKMI